MSFQKRFQGVLIHFKTFISFPRGLGGATERLLLEAFKKGFSDVSERFKPFQNFSLLCLDCLKPLRTPLKNLQLPSSASGTFMEPCRASYYTS